MRDVENLDSPQRPCLIARVAKSLLAEGLALAIAVAVGVQYGADHPAHSPRAIVAGYLGEDPSPSHDNQANERQSLTAEDLPRLISAISDEVSKLVQARENLQTADREAGIALNLLKKDGVSKESPEAREQARQRQKFGADLKQVDAELKQARDLEDQLREVNRALTAGSSGLSLDGELRDKVKVYLKRISLKREMDQ